MNGVTMRGRALVATVQKLVGVPDHLAEKRRQRAELDRLLVGRQVNALVNQRPHQRQVRIGPPPRQPRDARPQTGLVLLLQLVDGRHVYFFAALTSASQSSTFFCRLSRS